MQLHDLQIDDAALADFCRRSGIRELLFFGSVVSDNFRPDSDVDIFIDLQDHAAPSLLDLARLQLELSNLLGRQAHVHTERMLPPAYKHYFLKGARRGYAA